MEAITEPGSMRPDLMRKSREHKDDCVQPSVLSAWHALFVWSCENQLVQRATLVTRRHSNGSTGAEKPQGPLALARKIQPGFYKRVSPGRKKDENFVQNPSWPP